MKKLFFALLAIGACLSVHAQQYSTVTMMPYTTNTVLATGTSNYTTYANCKTADHVGIYISSKLDGAGTEDMVFKFAKSADGALFETTPSISITNAANGTTLVKSFSSVDVTGVHTLQLVSIKNNNATQNLTNIVVKIGVKNYYIPR